MLGSNSLKVIIIDDNKDLTEITCELLDMLGYEVISALNGQDGIEKAKEYLPQVILCDIGMPGMSGYEVAERIRKDNGLRQIYLIAVSGYSSQDAVERSVKAGFDRYMVKPVNIDTLKIALDEVSIGYSTSLSGIIIC